MKTEGLIKEEEMRECLLNCDIEGLLASGLSLACELSREIWQSLVFISLASTPRKQNIIYINI